MNPMRFLASIVFSVIAVASVSGNGDSSSDGAAEYVLRFNHVLTENDPFHGAFLEWAGAVEERTGGKLVIDVFHSSRLGVEENVIDQIRLGDNVGQNTDAARLGNFVPALAVMNGPYFIDSLEEVRKLKSLPTVRAWLDELQEDYGIKVLSFSWVQGFRNLMTNVPVRSPEDLEGLRIRSPNAPIWMESIESLGAIPVALNYGEVYTGVRTGVIDGAGNVFPAAYSTRMHEVLDYMSETRHILLVNFEIVSAEWFRSLPEEYQAILEEECERAGLRVSREIMGRISEEAKARLSMEGMTVLPYESLDIPSFKAASVGAYEALGLLDVRNMVFSEMDR